MNTRNRCLALSALLACAAGLMLASPGRADPDEGPGKAPSLVGVWSSVVQWRDCATGADTRPPFISLTTFHRDLTSLEEATGLSPANRIAAQGVWRRTGARTFVSRSELFAFDANGQPFLRIVFKREIVLSDDAQSSSITATYDRYLLDGTYVTRICSVETGTRLPGPTAP